MLEGEIKKACKTKWLDVLQPFAISKKIKMRKMGLEPTQAQCLQDP